jgi:AcrR family transcriptional regulator
VGSEVDRGERSQRIVAGAARAVAERGFPGARIADVVAYSRISRGSFYEHFESMRDCVLAAHDQAFDRLIVRLDNACFRESDPAEGLAAAVVALIEFSRLQPDDARMLMRHGAVTDPVLAGRILRSNEILVELLRSGVRNRCPAAAVLPHLMEATMVGAVTSLVGSRLAFGELDALLRLQPELIEFVLMPYVGHERARRMALDRSAHTA